MHRCSAFRKPFPRVVATDDSENHQDKNDTLETAQIDCCCIDEIVRVNFTNQYFLSEEIEVIEVTAAFHIDQSIQIHFTHTVIDLARLLF